MRACGLWGTATFARCGMQASVASKTAADRKTLLENRADLPLPNPLPWTSKHHDMPSTRPTKKPTPEQAAQREKQRILDVLHQRADEAHKRLNYAEEQRLRDAFSLVHGI